MLSEMIMLSAYFMNSQQQPKESVHPISDDSDINVKSSSSQENIIFNSKENSLRKRKKHRNPHLKKHEASNCGTKEPKRPSETHIEWRPQGKVRFKWQFR